MNKRILKSGLLLFFLGRATLAFGQTSAQKLPANFYKHFTGTVAGQRVQVDLQSVGGVMGGTYYYNKYDEPIQLNFLEEQSDETHWVFGENVSENASNQSYPIWKCTLKGDSLTGTWVSADGTETHVIQLREHYPAGVMRFTYQSDKDKIPFDSSDNKTPHIDLRISYPVAIGGGELAPKINRKIKLMLGFEANLPLEEGRKLWKQKYVEDYWKSLRSMDAKIIHSYAGNWRRTVRVNIQYNANGYVQLNKFVQHYLGGAHGGYQTTIMRYDIQKEREVKLSDITTIDSLALQRLLEKQFRINRGIHNGESLKQYLYTDALPPTDNFSFDYEGIQFIYNPYEVAGYAAGPIYLFIPYKNLQGTLLPEFARRMNLDLEVGQVHTRKSGETPTQFVKRIIPKTAELIPHQVFETHYFGAADEQAILYFYSVTVHRVYQMDTYVDHSKSIFIAINVLLPTVDKQYERIKIGSIYPEGGGPMIRSVFYVNADRDADKELAVLVKYPQRHYDYSGAFYGTQIFDYDKAEKQFTYLTDLSETFFGCECGWRDGRTETANYKTAAAVKAKLKAMGF